MGGLMQPTDTRAGGCFLMGGLLAGFVAGLAMGNALLGVWIGLAAGTVIAVGIWLADRNKGGD
jgi:predicted lipid-binding transport protein (Tim44 family)